MVKHILQSKEWGEFRKATANVKRVLNIGNSLVFIHNIPFLPWTVAYLPRPETLDNSEEIKKACRKENAIYLKVEPTTHARPPLACVSKPILPRHTVYIDLTKSEEELLKEMHEKTRYNLRLAQKKGVIVKKSDDIETFIRLLSATENRQGFYSHCPDYYRKLFKILKPIILIAYVGNVPVATIMLFYYQEMLYYPYGGSDPKYKEYMAASLLHWEAIKLGKKLGCKTYDLWGTYKNTKDETDPWYGIYRFKSGFGGKEVDFPETFDIPLSPFYPLFSIIDSLRWKVLKLLR